MDPMSNADFMKWLGLINLIILIGGFIYQNGKNAQRNISFEGKLEKLDGKVEGIDDKVEKLQRNEPNHTALKEDLSELKNIVMKLGEAMTQLAVVAAKQTDHSAEILRTRERLHDLESHVRGLLSWREGIKSMEDLHHHEKA